MDHLQKIHTMSLDTEVVQFRSFTDFLAWKEKLERETHSWYIQHCAPWINNGKGHWYYYCSRAGKYNPRGKGERGMKSQGTSKTISHCSAHIKAIRNIKTNAVKAEFTSSHYSHDTQLGHLRMTNVTRLMIASKLKKGITNQRIIDDIRHCSENSQTNREHLISHKDINNIQKQFNIEGIRKHPNDLISVSSVVEEMDVLDYNPVLLFKQQGELPTDNCKALTKEDFVLVIQTEFQKDIFCKYGKDGVCMDATYKINDYDFHLITLIVLDGFQEGIPIAWALSNREDKTHILCALKERCGHIIPRWFMSDKAQQYYNAWKEVFEVNNTTYLWCAWHVDRAWRDGLNRYFHEKEQQRDVYHQLRVLMMDTGKAKFRTLLTKFLTLYHSNYPAFTEYFNSFYCSHIEQWAMCYRIGTPMNSESFHRVLKIVYLRHKHNRQIDYLVHILLKIARDKAFEQLQKLEKGKHTHRICDINKRHKTAVSFAVLAKIEVEDNNAYRVNSQSRQGLSYIVERMKQSCTCNIKCQF